MEDHNENGHGENAKQIEALAELIQRYAEKHEGTISTPDATLAARAVTTMFDLAGHRTLVALKDAIKNGASDDELLKTLDPLKRWVADMIAAGPYVDVGGTDNQGENCAGEICC